MDFKSNYLPALLTPLNQGRGTSAEHPKLQSNSFILSIFWITWLYVYPSAETTAARKLDDAA